MMTTQWCQFFVLCTGILSCSSTTAGRVPQLRNTSNVTKPSWDFTPANQVELCYPPDGDEYNSRLVFVATPNNTPPAPSGKWPVYVHFVDFAFPPANLTKRCPVPDQAKNFHAFDTPEKAVGRCFEGKGAEKCNWNDNSGGLWDQRLKQYLLSNGFAVLLINPYAVDLWEASPYWWNGFGHGEGGRDRPFLARLFSDLAKGAFGPLDADRLVFHGFSSGAQMVSWMFQVAATNKSVVFPDGGTIAAGVMLSGGSYNCYNDNTSYIYGPDSAMGSCIGCIAGDSDHCFYPPVGERCSTCDETVVPYCQQCCPRNFTEQYYDDHPEDYASHPPVLLAGMTTADWAADLCGPRHYHDTLVSRGVETDLILVAEEDESCFCVGTPDTDSPYKSRCNDSNWEGGTCFPQDGGCCIGHTQGFGAFVEPAVAFVRKACGI